MTFVINCDIIMLDYSKGERIMKLHIKILSVFLGIIIFFNISLCYASGVSDWAKSDIKEIISMNLLPDILKNTQYDEPITRAEFCYLIANLYTYISNQDIPFGIEGFADTFDIVICGAAEMGIINGYPDGFFYPDNPITRQELATVICRTLSLCGIDTSKISAESIEKISNFHDKNSLAAWASDNVAFCMTNNIIKGTGENTLSPLGTTTREQAIVMVKRCIDSIKEKNAIDLNMYDTLKCDVSGEIEHVSYINRALSIKWEPVSGANEYNVSLYLSQKNFWYTNEDTFVKQYTSQTNDVTLKNMRAGKMYKIVIDAIDLNGSVIKTFTGQAYPNELYTLEEKEQIIFSDGQISSKEQADLQMQDVTVKVWALDKNGNKYTSQMTMKVNKKIANLVEMVFDEIYNGEEKFPFKDVGAYSWRNSMSSGSLSHHNYGTAIDLNYNENYCIYKNGSYTGKYWKPYEDVYSFPADGEVVSIFAKYGFAWGGDEWSNPKDYMHFSYLEM